MGQLGLETLAQQSFFNIGLTTFLVLYIGYMAVHGHQPLFWVNLPIFGIWSHWDKKLSSSFVPGAWTTGLEVSTSRATVIREPNKSPSNSMAI
jgi:hypothetical protein